jgi:uncharacterized integral membrane protein
MARYAFWFALLFTSLLALLVSAMNPQSVGIELAFARVNASIGVALLSAIAIGFLLGSAWRMTWIGELLSERGRLRRALRVAEKKARAVAAADDDAR